MKRLVLLIVLLSIVVAAFSVTAVGAQGPSKQYIVISRSQFGVSAAVLNQIRAAGGKIEQNLSRIGLVVASSRKDPGRFDLRTIGTKRLICDFPMMKRRKRRAPASLRSCQDVARG